MQFYAPPEPSMYAVGWDCTDQTVCDDCERIVIEAKNDHHLPSVPTTLTPQEVKSRLTKLSKQGKLPGFITDEDDALCSVAAHGTPFDSKLLIQHHEDSLSFQRVMLPTMPIVFFALLVVTVWPGLPLTDGFLSSFDWYTGLMNWIGIDTWHWYLPLTILPAPFAMFGAIKKSRSSAHESALVAIEKIRACL